MSFEEANYRDSYVKIDGIGNIYTTPSQCVKKITDEKTILIKDMHCPYPVKKGQVVSVTLEFPFILIAKINFASCISV